MVWLEGNDSENTIEIHYSQNNFMSSWSSRIESEFEKIKEELAADGYDNLWIKTQIDWSIDSQDDWKVNDYWLTEGYDKDFRQHLGDWAYIAQSYSAETAMSEWIFRNMGNIDDPEDRVWYGSHEGGDDYSGWKDVLKEDQYDIIKGEDESRAKIDLDKHTIYARVRWLVTVRPLEGDDAAPVISDLRYNGEEFNGYPVVAFKLAVDETLAKQVAQVSGTQGGISLEVEAKVQGSDEWVGLQGDWIVKAGEMTSALLQLAEKEKDVKEGTPIELRARYCCAQPEIDDFFSPWSETITFGSQEMTVTTATVTEAPVTETTVTTTTAAPAPKEKEEEDKCWLCGFCPCPLGLCIFIWIAIIIVVGIVILLIAIKKKKDGNKKE